MKISDENSLPGLYKAVFSLSSLGESRFSFSSSSYWAIKSVSGTHSHDLITNCFLKAPFQILSYSGLGLQPMNFERMNLFHNITINWKIKYYFAPFILSFTDMETKAQASSVSFMRSTNNFKSHSMMWPNCAQREIIKNKPKILVTKKKSQGPSTGGISFSFTFTIHFKLAGTTTLYPIWQCWHPQGVWGPQKDALQWAAE